MAIAGLIVEEFCMSGNFPDRFPLTRLIVHATRRLIFGNIRDDKDFPFLDSYGLNVMLHNMPPQLRSPGWMPIPGLTPGI